MHHVDRVGRTERLREHIAYAGALQHRPSRTTGNHPRTRRCRPQQHDTGSLLALHRMRDGALNSRHVEEVLLRFLNTFGNRRGNFLGLPVADADGAVAIAHHHKRGEAEPSTALDDLGHAVDRNDPFDVVALLGGLATTIVTAATLPTGAASAALGSS